MAQDINILINSLRARGMPEDVIQQKLNQMGVSQQPQKGFLQKVGENLFETAVGLPRAVFQAGKSSGDALALSALEKELNTLQSQPLTEERVRKAEEIANKMKAITQPSKFGWSQEQLNFASQGGEAERALRGGFIGGKQGAGTASFFVPGGGGAATTALGRVGTAAGRGLLSGVLYGVAQSPEGMYDQGFGEAIKQTAGQGFSGGVTGGITGGVLQGLGEVYKAVRPSGVVKTVGEDLREQVGGLSREAGKTPFFSSNIKNLQKVRNNLGIKGSVPAQLDQVNKAFTSLDDQAVNELSGIATTYNKNAVKKFLAENIKKSARFKVNLSDAKVSQALDDLVDDIFRTSTTGMKGAGVNKLGLFNYKKNLGTELSRAFSREGIESVTPPNEMEELGMAVYRGLKGLIDDGAPQSVSKLTEQQAALFDISSALARKYGKFPLSLGAFSLNFGPLARPAQSILDTAGRGLSGVGKVVGGAENVAGTVLPQTAGRVAPMLPTAVGMSMEQQPQQQPIQQQQMQPQAQPTAPSMGGGLQPGSFEFDEATGTLRVRKQGGNTQNDFNDPNYIYQLMTQDIQQTGGKNITKLNQLFSNAMKLQELKEKQVPQESQGARSLGYLKGLYESVQKQGLTGTEYPVVGRYKGLLGKGAAKTQLSPEAAAYDAIKYAFGTSISRASGEKGTLTDKDRQVIIDALPAFTDTPETARLKWEGFGGLLGIMEQKYGMSPGTLSNMLSSLSGVPTTPSTNLGY